MRAVAHTEPDTPADTAPSDALAIERSLREPERFTELAGRLDARALSGRLAAALAELADRDREVLLLVAWAQLSLEEAAQALGIPAGTARSRLHRARTKTRAALADADPGRSP